MRCLTPYTMRRNGESHSFPCGKCYQCRMRRAHGWAFRLSQEYKADRTLTASFVTLTYDTLFVPITDSGRLTLRPRDLTLFFKRLRWNMEKKYGNTGIKYFACGEYGSQFGRPHYHAIIFNADVDEIDRSWFQGSVHFGQVEEASIMYTLKYMVKEQTIRESFDDRAPEFQRMSKGLGQTYLTDEVIAYHRNDLFENYYLPLRSGGKCPMPRYYREKIYTDSHKIRIAKYYQLESVREDLLSPSLENALVNRFEQKLKKSTLSQSIF